MLSEADVDLTVCFDRGKSPVWHFPQNQTRQLVSALTVEELAAQSESFCVKSSD